MLEEAVDGHAPALARRRADASRQALHRRPRAPVHAARSSGSRSTSRQRSRSAPSSPAASATASSRPRRTGECRQGVRASRRQGQAEARHDALRLRRATRKGARAGNEGVAEPRTEGPLGQELATPSDFEAAAAMVDEDDVAELDAVRPGSRSRTSKLIGEVRRRRLHPRLHASDRRQPGRVRRVRGQGADAEALTEAATRCASRSAASAQGAIVYCLHARFAPPLCETFGRPRRPRRAAGSCTRAPRRRPRRRARRRPRRGRTRSACRTGCRAARSTRSDEPATKTSTTQTTIATPTPVRSGLSRGRSSRLWNAVVAGQLALDPRPEVEEADHDRREEDAAPERIRDQRVVADRDVEARHEPQRRRSASRDTSPAARRSSTRTCGTDPTARSG